MAFFLDNHQEYIEKAIKPIAKKKTQGYEKKKKIDLLQQTTKRLPKISYYTII
jgi:predicted RNA-binding protein with EMAP domain